MRCVKRFGLTFMAMLALSAALVATTLAAGGELEGELLGAGGVYETKDSGTATLESTGGGIVVKCTSSKGEFKPLSEVVGQFREHFKGCTAAGIGCTGLLAGEATGEITISGETEVLAFKSATSVLRLALVYYLQKARFDCAAVLVEVGGAVIGEITNHAMEKSGELKSSLVGIKGKEVLTTVNGVGHHLEVSIGGSSFVEASLSRAATATGQELEVMY